jgi:hypothetical protein
VEDRALANLPNTPRLANQLPRAVVRHLFIVFLTCCACATQSITVGVISGGRLTDDVLTFPAPVANSVGAQAAFRLQSRFYDVGPMIELRLNPGFAVEFDALYHRKGFFPRLITTAVITPPGSATIFGNFRCC